MTHHTFDTPTPIELSVEIGSGSVHVDAAETDVTEVDVEGGHADQARVEFDGTTVTVHGVRAGFLSRGGDLHVRVSLPLESGLVARLGSADLTATGRLGRVGVKNGSGDVALHHVGGRSGIQTGSGDITVDRASGDLRLQSGSGDIRLVEADGEVSISTGSGDVSIGQTSTAVEVKTGSGDLQVGRSTDATTFSTGSGDLRVDRAERGRITTKGASGSVALTIPAGLPVWTDLRTISGSIHSGLASTGEPEPGHDHLEIRSTTASGDITLTQA